MPAQPANRIDCKKLKQWAANLELYPPYVAKFLDAPNFLKPDFFLSRQNLTGFVIDTKLDGVSVTLLRK
jgi:hypothetical protein